jgi:hypothetical protein
MKLNHLHGNRTFLCVLLRIPLRLRLFDQGTRVV